MRTDVDFMIINSFIIAGVSNLLVVVKRRPWRKRKKKHPQHCCSQHSLDMYAFLVHLKAKLHNLSFKTSY